MRASAKLRQIPLLEAAAAHYCRVQRHVITSMRKCHELALSVLDPGMVILCTANTAAVSITDSNITQRT